MIRLNLESGMCRAAAFAAAMLPALTYAGSVTLNEVWNRALNRNPTLAGAAAAVQAAAGRVNQACLPPNPELELATEDYGRSEVEVGLTLPLEILGQRRARLRAARAGMNAARLEESVARLELRAEVLRRFSSALALRLKGESADTLIGLLRASCSDITRRIDAGAAAELDLLREQIELKAVELEKSGLERSYRAACRALASIGAEPPDVEWEPVGMFIEHPETPDRTDVMNLLPEHPAVRLGQVNIEAARAGLAEARGGALPELALSGAYRRNVETGEGAVLLGLSLPLPVLNWNQGEIRAARHEVVGAGHAAAGDRLDREAEAGRVLAELAGLSERIDTGFAVILPAQRRVLATLTRHYEQGAVGILDLIEAQRTFHETSVELIDALTERVSLVADLVKTAGVEPVAIKE